MRNLLTATRRRTIVAIAAIATGALVSTAEPAQADWMVGSHIVKGKIAEAYFATGGAAKWGFPSSDELDAKKPGKFQMFANNSSFYWNPTISGGVAHQIGGAIRVKWSYLNWEYGPLGWPTSNEIPIAVNPVTGWFEGASAGAYQTFQNGVVYFSGATGAHPIWGEIYKIWKQGTISEYGYPASDEYRIPGGFAQDFQRGSITWRP